MADTTSTSSTQAREGDEVGKARMAPEPGQEAVRKAASGAEVSPQEEVSALEFLLGPTQPLEADVDVRYRTPRGEARLTIRVRQIDAKVAESHDAKHRSDVGLLDEIGYSCAVLADCAVSLTDATGRTIAADGQEFIGGAPTPEIAWAARFRYQGYIVSRVAQRVQEISGMDGDTVGVPRMVGGSATVAEAGNG